MKATPFALTLALALALLASGCGGAAPGVWAFDGGAPPADYDGELATWTRSQETYEFFESRVFVHATYLSPRFAAAYSAFEAEREALTRAEGEKRLAERVAAAQSGARFVALTTHDTYWDDLDAKHGTLRVVLRDGDVEIAPTRIQRLSYDEMADIAPYFPYLGPLTTAYWIDFHLPPDPKRVLLRIAGPPAVVDLYWETR